MGVEWPSRRSTTNQPHNPCPSCQPRNKAYAKRLECGTDLLALEKIIYILDIAQSICSLREVENPRRSRVWPAQPGQWAAARRGLQEATLRAWPRGNSREPETWCQFSVEHDLTRGLQKQKGDVGGGWWLCLDLWYRLGTETMSLPGVVSASSAATIALAENSESTSKVLSPFSSRQQDEEAWARRCFQARTRSMPSCI